MAEEERYYDKRPPWLPEVDLRSISRPGMRTSISVVVGLRAWPWITLGALHYISLEHQDGRHFLEARMRDGVTDFEHDSVHILVLPICGVQFKGLYGGCAHIDCVLDAYRPNDYRVPRAGYDPTKEDKDVVTCTKCEEPHLIVGEGFYQPPEDIEGYAKLRGRRLQIHIGPEREE